MGQDRASDLDWLVNFATSETNKNGKKMSKARLAFPVEVLQGKVNKKDSAYFAMRNGNCYLNRIINPYTGEPTANQLDVQDKFKTVTQQVSRIMKQGPGSDQYDLYKAEYDKNPGKATSLRGYIFAKLWE